MAVSTDCSAMPAATVADPELILEVGEKDLTLSGGQLEDSSRNGRNDDSTVEGPVALPQFPR